MHGSLRWPRMQNAGSLARTAARQSLSLACRTQAPRTTRLRDTAYGFDSWLVLLFPDFGLGKPYGPGLYTPLSICVATESTRCSSDSRPVMMASAICRAVTDAPQIQPR